MSNLVAFPTATEAQDMEAIFAWRDVVVGTYPELALLYHIPNEGRRGWKAQRAVKRGGVLKGIPDICLPVARCGFIGLYIEQKREGEKPTPEQLRIARKLRDQNHAVYLSYTAGDTQQIILNYITGRA